METTHVPADDLRRALIAADPRLSKFNPLPRILAFDEFNTGTHGWCELIGNHDGHGNLDTVDVHMRDFRPPQLSACDFFDIGTHGAMSGNYALKIATRPVTGHTAVAIRRLTMAQRGVIQFETYFTYKGEAATAESSLGNSFGDVEWDGNLHPSEAPVRRVHRRHRPLRRRRHPLPLRRPLPEHRPGQQVHPALDLPDRPRADAQARTCTTRRTCRPPRTSPPRSRRTGARSTTSRSTSATTRSRPRSTGTTCAGSSTPAPGRTSSSRSTTGSWTCATSRSRSTRTSTRGWRTC